MIEAFSGGFGLLVMMCCKDGREVMLKNAGDLCNPRPIVTTYFLVVVRFPYEISCFLALVPNTVVSK